jgi:hypothetical protein
MRPPIIPAIVVTIAVLAASALPVPAQTTSKDVSQKASETGQAIKDYTLEKHAEAVAHAQQVTELSRATKASWEKAKEGFADAYRDLASAYDKAAAEFKK